MPSVPIPQPISKTFFPLYFLKSANFGIWDSTKYLLLLTSLKYSFVPIESRFYIHSYNYMTSSDYKPYASHVGSGNHLAYPFANKIVKKYYKNNILRPVIFFNQPYSTG